MINYLALRNEERFDAQDMQHAHGKICITFWFENLKGRDVGIDGKIIVKLIS
jgi:hypothetical protein